MKLVKLNGDDVKLVEKARLLLEKRGSDISGVSAGVLTVGGEEFYGLCIDAKTATVGMCAEFSAVGAMVTAGERKISTMVAVTRREDGYAILPPCGKCRDLARAFGDPYVILQTGGSVRDAAKVRVSGLVPYPWDGAPAR